MILARQVIVSEKNKIVPWLKRGSFFKVNTISPHFSVAYLLLYLHSSICAFDRVSVTFGFKG